MTRSPLAVPLAALALAAGAGLPLPLAAETPDNAPERQVLEYAVRHAQYGEIGTYTNVIERRGDTVDVRSSLRIGVKFLGLTLYREEAERRERWQGDRLVLFRSVTEKNGETIEVDGEARGGTFVIRAPWGTAEAPPDVRPSNPWSAGLIKPSTMMSTTTGRLFRTTVKGGDEALIPLNGRLHRLRQYEIHSDKREFVWLDERDRPVAFGTESDGARVEFVLVRASDGSDRPPATARADKLLPAEPRPLAPPLVEAHAE